MRGMFRCLVVSLALLGVLSGSDAANLHGTPDAMQEMQAWFGDALRPYIVAGCRPTVPTASLTLGAFACQAYVRSSTGALAYVTQPSASLGPLTAGDGTYWVALTRSVTDTIPGWTRQPGTHYLWQQGAPSTVPDPLPEVLPLAWVDVAGDAITRVQPTASPNPIPSTSMSPGTDVRECGARVDGVTDDTEALNDCLARYSHVMIPMGIMKVSTPILMGVGNHLSGAGPLTPATGTPESGSVITSTSTTDIVSVVFPALSNWAGSIKALTLRSGTSQNGIHLKNLADGVIEHVLVNGQAANGQPATGNSNAAIFLEGSFTSTDSLHTIRIDKAWLQQNAGDGIRASGVNNLNAITVVNSRIQGNGGHGIYTLNRARGWHIAGNDIEGNAVPLIQFDDQESTVITGNYFEVNGTGQTPMIWLKQGKGIVYSGNEHTGAGSGPGLTSIGLLLGEGASGYLVQGITITGNKFQNMGYGVYVDGVRGLTMLGNYMGPDVNVEQGGVYGNALTVTTVSNTETLATVAGVEAAVVGVANTAAETPVYTKTVKGNWLRAGGGLLVHLSGAVVNNTGANQLLRVRLKLGGTTLQTLQWGPVATDAAPRAFVLRAFVAAGMGGDNTKQICWSQGDLGPGGSVTSGLVGSGVTTVLATCNNAVGVSVLVDQVLTVTVELGAADTNLSFVREMGQMQRWPF